jgi:hypothetical protein
LARQVPEDWAALRQFLGVQQELFLKWGWVRTMIPQTYAHTMELYNRYGQAVRQDPCNPDIAHELTDMVERFKRLGG